MAIEEPKYQLIAKESPFEIRAYSSRLLAEVALSGNLQSISRNGFRMIAGYIFGDNAAKDNKAVNIKMTAPVSVKSDGTVWKLNFFMPAQYTKTSIPKPNNRAVKLTKVSSGLYAVIRFSGFVNEAKFKQKTEMLNTWLKNRGLEVDGDAELARYNPPWTLPFFRRNEVMIRIKNND